MDKELGLELKMLIMRRVDIELDDLSFRMDRVSNLLDKQIDESLNKAQKIIDMVDQEINLKGNDNKIREIKWNEFKVHEIDKVRDFMHVAQNKIESSFAHNVKEFYTEVSAREKIALEESKKFNFQDPQIEKELENFFEALDLDIDKIVSNTQAKLDLLHKEYSGKANRIVKSLENELAVEKKKYVNGETQKNDYKNRNKQIETW